MISSSEFNEPRSRQERQERRVRLEKESEIVKAQIQELKNRLPQLYKTGPANVPTKQGNVSKKRPAPIGVEAGDSKRQRVELERARRVNSIWQQCQTILKGLSKSKDAHPFLKPVDVKYSKCPDYFEIIKHPMDLGTIQKKFPGKGKLALRPSDPNTYSTPYEFRDDMRLVWSNCRTYNPPHVPVRNMGEAMSDAWEKRWTISGIEAKWDEEMHKQSLEEQDLAGGGDMAHQMQVNHEALVKKVSASEANPGYTAPEDGGAMSFEQKRRLSIAIGQLPGDRISEVLRIIAEDESMRLKADSEEEIEVDIDQLSAEILWKLDRYARGIAQKVRKKTGQKAPEAQAAKPAGNPPPASQPPEAYNGKNEKSGHHNSSSSSSGDSGTDRSESGSEGEVGSKNIGYSAPPSAPAGQRRPADGGNDAVTLISATTPAEQPQIVKTMALKKEVNLQNANAWADLGKEKGDEEEGDGDGDGGDDDDKDQEDLWNEFKSREQKEEQREKEKKAEEERQRQERLRKEEAARADAEKAAQEAEASKKAQKEEEAAKIKAQRDKEMEELQNVRDENYEAGAQELLDSKKQGNTLNVLGLQAKESSDDDSDDDSDS